jgi:hypothetical protein
VIALPFRCRGKLPMTDLKLQNQPRLSRRLYAHLYIFSSRWQIRIGDILNHCNLLWGGEDIYIPNESIVSKIYVNPTTLATVQGILLKQVNLTQ